MRSDDRAVHSSLRTLFHVGIVLALGAWIVVAFCRGMFNPIVPMGGDPPGYLLDARYDPLLDRFDNPAHGWGYPALIKGMTCLNGDEYLSGKLISALSYVVFGLMSWLILRRIIGPPYLYLNLALVLLHPVVLDLAFGINSDMLFAALVSVVIYLVFVRPVTPLAALLAGALATYAVFVRGNGAALLLVSGLMMLCRQCRWKSTIAFASGSIACFAGAFAAADLVGAKARDVVRSGAGELAFCMLDKTGTWRYRQDYETAYPSYGPLLREHWRLLARQAGKAMYRLHEWWLLPALGPLGLFVFPGLILWLRRGDPFRFKLACAFAAVQATYIWSAIFQDPRHLLPSLLFWSFLGLHGARLLPATITIRAGRTFRAPFRWPCAVLLTIACLAPGSVFLLKHWRPGPWEIEAAMQKCGDWLSTAAAPDDRVAATRLNIGYYARLRPVDYTGVFPDVDPTPEQAIELCMKQHCRWLVWIEGHSHYEYPSLKMLQTLDHLPGAALVYRDSKISLWKVDLAPDDVPHS
jgi:hypothetical protein